ncbi:MAG: hypothetical protein ACR2M3_02800 [Thermomicrobiales bacterium]
MASTEHIGQPHKSWIEQPDVRWAVTNGVIGGIMSGIIFAIAEILGGHWISGDPYIMPFKAYASLPLGRMPPTIATSTAIPVGLITHLILSILFGIIVALIISSISALRTAPVVTVIAATVFGFVLWIVNFYVLVPLINRPWFKMAPAGQQFFYHTFFFGTVLGLYLMLVLPPVRQSET